MQRSQLALPWRACMSSFCNGMLHHILLGPWSAMRIDRLFPCVCIHTDHGMIILSNLAAHLA